MPVGRQIPLAGRACVIGAGSSGIASCQALHTRGIPFDCFESGSDVGGNWRYNNDNDMSSAYLSLHAKSSRRCLQYAALPMPDHYPDYLSHEWIAKYLDNFVDHFGFRGRIQFRTEVTWVEHAVRLFHLPSGGRWVHSPAPGSDHWLENGVSGDLSPTSQVWPNGSVNPPWR